jgi:Protein of unknown function (DUF3489)
MNNVIPITRGRRSRLELIVSPGPTSITYSLQPIPSPIQSKTYHGRAALPRRPGRVLAFRLQTQKGSNSVSSFRIDDDSHVHVVPDGTGQDGSVFSTVEDLKQMAAGWPMRRLADIWNNLPGVRPVTRFENRDVAVQRIWRALHPEVSSGQPGKSRGKRQRHSRETKLQLILRMLRSPEGATLTALMKATRWQAHSVRGFLSGKVAKNLGLPVESFRRDDERVYRLPAAE